MSRGLVGTIASLLLLGLAGCGSTGPQAPTGPPPRYSTGDLTADILTAGDEPAGWAAGPVIDVSTGDSVPGPCDGRPQTSVPGSPKIVYRNLTGRDAKSTNKITLSQYVLVFRSNELAQAAVTAMRSWAGKCPAVQSYPRTDTDGSVAAHTARTTVVPTAVGDWQGFFCVRAVTFQDPTITSDDRTLVLAGSNAVTYITMEEHVQSATPPNLGAPTGGPSAAWLGYVQPFFARIAKIPS